MHNRAPHHQNQLPPSLNGYVRPAHAASAAASKYRVKWDNILIIAVAILACLVVVPMLLKVGPDKPAAPASTAAKKSTSPASDEDVVKSTMSLAAAQDLVEQARVAMNEGRFSDATALLSRIAGPVSDESGASTLRDQVARRMAEHEALTTDLGEAVEAEDWQLVLTTLGQLKALAPLTGVQLDLARRAGSQLKAQEAYGQALAAYERGDLREALTIASAANDRYHTDALAALEDKIAAELRQQNADRNGGTTSSPTMDSTGGGTASGGGSGSSSGGHSHSSGSGSSGGSATGALGTAGSGSAGTTAGAGTTAAGGFDIQALLNGILGQGGAGGLNNLAIGGETGGVDIYN